jgi:hypothetical protein
MSSVSHTLAAGSEIPLSSKLPHYIVCRRFFERRPLTIATKTLTMTVKPVVYLHRAGKRPREESAMVHRAATATPSSRGADVVVSGANVTPSRGFVQLGKRGLWSTTESSLLFYDELHLKLGWMLAQRGADGKLIVLTTVMAKHVDDGSHPSSSFSHRWSRYIGRAAVVVPGDVLEIVEISTSRT